MLFVARDFYGVANSQEAAAALLAVQPDRSLAADAVWQQANRADGAIAAPGAGDATEHTLHRQLIKPAEGSDKATAGSR